MRAITNARVSRRLLLRAAAGITLPLPHLASLLPRGARASGPAAVKRYIAYVQPLSIFAEKFWPTAPGHKPYDFAQGWNALYWTGEGALDNASFALSPSTTPLESVRNEILFVEGIANVTGNHGGYCSLLTGRAPTAAKSGGGISLDQELAKTIGRGTRFPSLQLGVRAHGVSHKEAVSWLGREQAMEATSDPQAVFRRLFADLDVDPAELDRVRLRKRSVLDAALEQARAMTARASREDAIKLGQYLEAFREMERRLALTVPAGCQVPTPSGSTVPAVAVWDKRPEMVPEETRVQLDLLAMALACDLTRVVTFQMNTEANNMTHPWLDVSTRWHDLSHTSQGTAGWQKLADDQVKIARWNMEQLAYLVGRLKALGVWEGTLLQYTVNMNHGQLHASRNVPMLLLGNAGGALKTGRHVRLPALRYNTDLLVTVLNALGVPAASFGEPDKCKGPITELLA